MQTAIESIDHTALNEVARYWDDTLAVVKDLPCQTEEQEKWWAGCLAKVQTCLAELEAERETLVRPLITDKSRIDGLFKEAARPANDVKALIKAKLQARAEARLAAQTAARQAAQLAAQSGDSGACAEALASIPDAVVTDGSSTSWVWEVETVDTALLPREYWVVDYAQLNNVATEARKSETAPVVPGVVFKRTARVAARRGKK